MATWNDRLELARIRRDISPADLARLIGISAATMSDWRSNQIKKLSAEHAFAACEALKIRMAWLLHGKGDMDEGIQDQAAAYNLTPKHEALLGYFDSLTPSQQTDLMRSLSETQQRNDELLAELLARRKAR
ncbi:MAG: helix-turn-helix domain-containing protein [Gammaproteobacteria bacterium]|nr:helix-turn-helix domain-containing protein [Gammaproteobacteria bacterium]